MNIENVFRILINSLIIKIEYLFCGKKLDASFFQLLSWDINIEIRDFSHIKIGKYCSSR